MNLPHPSKSSKNNPPHDAYTGDPTAELAFRRGFHHAVQFALTHIESLPDDDGLAGAEADLLCWLQATGPWRDRAVFGHDYRPEGTPMPGRWGQ